MSKIADTQNRLGADEDHEAVSACQKGNADAFRVLVEKYQKRMVNMAYRMTGDYEEACEVVQEAFLSAYRTLKTFRGEATFATWLYTITMNHARNRIKQMTSRARHEEATLDDPIETQDGTYARVVLGDVVLGDPWGRCFTACISTARLFLPSAQRPC